MCIYGMDVKIYQILEDLETEDSREYLHLVQVSEWLKILQVWYPNT